MKFFRVEYRLIPGAMINRGEIGGLDHEKDFKAIEEAESFVNQYKIYSRGNKVDKVDDNCVYHLYEPKIWEMRLRGYLRAFELIKEIKVSDWKHRDGDIYIIEMEFFNVKTRLMEYSQSKQETLEKAFEKIKSIKDSTNRLLSDWSLYSKSLVKSN